MQRTININDHCREQLAQLVETQATPPASITKQLYREFGGEITDMMLESAKLQVKARAKFGDGVWWVTERALQQATAWQVARLKASWLGAGPVSDLCCGIGGDMRWIAGRGDVIGVDLDPVMTSMALANVHGNPSTSNRATPHCASVEIDDALRFARKHEHAIHIDPDRRAGDRRSSQPERYEPDWKCVLEIASLTRAALIKLAPAAEIETTSITLPCHRAWISLRSAVREQTLLVGDAVANAGLVDGKRSAIALHGDGSFERFAAIASTRRAPSCLMPGEWLVDPDAAIRAAGLTDEFALQHQLSVVGSPSGFLTCNQPADQLALCIVGQVEWSGAWDERKLKKAMRSHDVYPDTAKVRGASHDPVRLTQSMRDCGTRPVTLWVGTVGKKVYVAWTTNHQKPGTGSIAN